MTTKTKTYDGQTAKLLAMIAENMPKISSDLMQHWIENPRAIKKVLEKTFCPSEVVISKNFRK